MSLLMIFIIKKFFSSSSSFNMECGATKSKVSTNLRYLGFSCTTLHVGVALCGGLRGVLGAGVAYVDPENGLHMFSLSFTFIRFTFSTTVIMSLHCLLFNNLLSAFC